MIKRLSYKLGLKFTMPEGLKLKITNLDKIYNKNIKTFQIFLDVFITIDENQHKRFAHVSVNAGKVALVAGERTVSEFLTERMDDMYFFKGDRMEISETFSSESTIISIEETLFETLSEQYLDIIQEKIIKKRQPLRNKQTTYHMFQLEPEKRNLELIKAIQVEKEIYYL